jgi:hypothetical protein
VARPPPYGRPFRKNAGKSLDEVNDVTVINGQTTRIETDAEPIDRSDASRVIDLSMISPKVQKAVAELVRRTALAGAWQAAYDYANNKFSGLELTFAIVELDKAKAAYKLSAEVDGEPLDGSVIMPPVTVAGEALQQARETLAAAGH